MPLLTLTDGELALIDGSGPVEQILAYVNESTYKHVENVRRILNPGR